MTVSVELIIITKAFCRRQSQSKEMSKDELPSASWGTWVTVQLSNRHVTGNGAPGHSQTVLPKETKARQGLRSRDSAYQAASCSCPPQFHDTTHVSSAKARDKTRDSVPGLYSHGILVTLQNPIGSATSVLVCLIAFSRSLIRRRGFVWELGRWLNGIQEEEATGREGSVCAQKRHIQGPRIDRARFGAIRSGIRESTSVSGVEDEELGRALEVVVDSRSGRGEKFPRTTRLPSQSHESLGKEVMTTAKAVRDGPRLAAELKAAVCFSVAGRKVGGEY